MTTNLLDQLWDVEETLATLDTHIRKTIDGLIPDEIKEEIAAVREETGPQREAAQAKITAIRAAIKEGVLEEGETIKGTRYQGVYTRGRLKVNHKAALAYVKRHPEAKVIFDQGNPSVSIRKVAPPKPTVQETIF